MAEKTKLLLVRTPRVLKNIDDNVLLKAVHIKFIASAAKNLFALSFSIMRAIALIKRTEVKAESKMPHTADFVAVVNAKQVNAHKLMRPSKNNAMHPESSLTNAAMEASSRGADIVIVPRIKFMYVFSLRCNLPKCKKVLFPELASLYQTEAIA